MIDKLITRFLFIYFIFRMVKAVDYGTIEEVLLWMFMSTIVLVGLGIESIKEGGG